MQFKFSYKLLIVLLLSGVFVNANANANANATIQTVKDMRELNRQASDADLPVLLLMTSKDCEYCKAVRDNYLLPMIKSGAYQNKILFRQLYIDEYDYLRNEKGELIAGDQVALKYDVEITPVILFINAQGQEVAERLVGISVADYFDKTLETHILEAQKNNPRYTN